MTYAMIQAILSLILAFSGDQTTVDNIRAILLPATTTPVALVPVVQTPLMQDQPVQFGSVLPVNSPTVDPVVVVPSTPMDKSGVFLEDATNRYPGWATNAAASGTRYLNIIVKDADGNVIADPAQTVALTVDGTLVQSGTAGEDSHPVYGIELNEVGGKVYPVKATPHSVVEVNYKGAIHTFSLDNL